MTTLTSQDGTSIAYDRTGDGPAVVLVDGATGTRAADADLAAQLASRFTVLTYNRRGREDSGDTAPYAIEREIEDLAAVIAEAGGEACVFGISSGANLVVRAAANGLGITKIALWEPNFRVDDSRPPLPSDYVAHLEELVAADRRGDAVEYFMTVAVGIPADFVAGMRQMPMWPGLEALAHTIAYDGRIIAGFALDAAPTASVTVPAWVGDGGQTPWLSSGAEALADALPNGRHQRIDGQAHGPEAEVIAPVLAEFFAS